MKFLFYTVYLICSCVAIAQNTIAYDISFENAVHHEAVVKIRFSEIKDTVLQIRMSRSSPGRYALHEFAKNVYGVAATDSKNNPLTIQRSDPYQWNVSGHDGTVIFNYTLFGDRADGTYSQIDERHAHLNMPATFAFARNLQDRPVTINFDIRDDLNWKVATQLKHLQGNQYYAPNMQYFMDSPTEISDFMLKEFEANSNGKKYNFKVVLHHQGSESIIKTYTEAIKKIVQTQASVFGELPDYDYGSYTFIGCYMPQASGDAMEHRNSTFLSGNFSLDEKGLERALSAASHEFFHCWNVERIRPEALEPFNFEKANMTGSLWFAEGFTNYYTKLSLVRAGILSTKSYIESLSNPLNYVINSPGREFHSPIEMSNYAPFADAATSIEPSNKGNTFVSYYTYGEVLGLALDLSLRNMETPHDLDSFMRLMWLKYGKPEIPYSIEEIESTLARYASPTFASDFFDKYIYNSELPDFELLLNSVGISFFKINQGLAYLGLKVRPVGDELIVSAYTQIGTPAYEAGLELGDKIKAINGINLTKPEALITFLNNPKVGEEITIDFERLDTKHSVKAILIENPELGTLLFEDTDKSLDSNRSSRRTKWLSGTD